MDTVTPPVFIGSLKVKVSRVVHATSAAPVAGVELASVGGAVSGGAAVVKVKVWALARSLPATSRPVTEKV